MVDRGAMMGFAHGWERPNWFKTKDDQDVIDTFQRNTWFDAVAREVEVPPPKQALPICQCFLVLRSLEKILAFF